MFCCLDSTEFVLLFEFGFSRFGFVCISGFDWLSGCAGVWRCFVGSLTCVLLIAVELI